MLYCISEFITKHAYVYWISKTILSVMVYKFVNTALVKEYLYLLMRCIGLEAFYSLEEHQY